MVVSWPFNEESMAADTDIPTCRDTRSDGAEDPRHDGAAARYGGIARRIEQVAQGSLALNPGTICPALLRLEQGWITSEWGAEARTAGGRVSTRDHACRKKQLAVETESWGGRSLLSASSPA